MYENWYSMEKNMEAVRSSFQREAEQHRKATEALAVHECRETEARTGFFVQVRRFLHVLGF